MVSSKIMLLNINAMLSLHFLICCVIFYLTVKLLQNFWAIAVCQLSQLTQPPVLSRPPHLLFSLSVSLCLSVSRGIGPAGLGLRQCEQPCTRAPLPCCECSRPLGLFASSSVGGCLLHPPGLLEAYGVSLSPQHLRVSAQVLSAQSLSFPGSLLPTDPLSLACPSGAHIHLRSSRYMSDVPLLLNHSIIIAYLDYLSLFAKLRNSAVNKIMHLII